MSLYTDQITNYLAQHPNSTEDEIATALEISIIDVLDTLHTLEKQGTVRSCDA